MTRKRSGRPTSEADAAEEAVTAPGMDEALDPAATDVFPPDGNEEHGSAAAEVVAADEAGAPTPSGSPDGVGQPTGVEAAVVAAFEVELAEALCRADEEKQRADDSWDRYLRAEAELENFRRRAERQREDVRFHTRRELLARVLEVSDNLERALGHSDAEPEQVVEGVEATYRELVRLLTREGVAPIEALEAPFDPELHEAVGVVPMPGIETEQVVAVERPGYTLNGELLRPARVIVGQPA